MDLNYLFKFKHISCWKFNKIPKYEKKYSLQSEISVGNLVQNMY
jgi:hypothetical protein